MRILHLLRPSVGGMRTHLLTLLRNIDHSRFQITLAAPAALERQIFDHRVEGVQFVPMELAESGGPVGLVYHSAQLSSLLRHEKYQILHAHGLRATMASGLGGSTTPVRVATLHNSILDIHPVARPLLSYSFRVQTHCIADSPALKADLLHLGVPKEHVTVIPNGVSLVKSSSEDVAAELAALRIPNSAQLIVFPIRLLGCLESAAKLITRLRRELPDVCVVIAGIAVNQSLQDQIRDSICDELVFFTGFVKDLRTVFAAASVIVVCDPPMSLPVTILEAMAEGVVVISKDQGEVGDLILDGVNGRLLSDTSTESFVGVIRDVLMNNSERERLAAAARERIASEFSDRASVNRLEALYDELTQQSMGTDGRAAV